MSEYSSGAWMLSDAQVATVADQLAGAARDRVAIDALVHEPRTLVDGYRIQAACHAEQERDPSPLIGWKAGCTSAAAQEMLRLDAPVAGRYRADQMLGAPAVLRFEQYSTAPRLEVEVGLRLLDDLVDVPADLLDLCELVEVFAAIEVVAGRLAAFPFISAPVLVADNVVGAAMIVGPTLDLTPAEIRSLDSLPVELSIDSTSVAAATGAEALGHPLRVLHWLYGHARSVGASLNTGDVVITGTCTGLVPARAGSSHVGRVGDVEVQLGFAHERSTDGA